MNFRRVKCKNKKKNEQKNENDLHPGTHLMSKKILTGTEYALEMYTQEGYIQDRVFVILLRLFLFLILR